MSTDLPQTDPPPQLFPMNPNNYKDGRTGDKVRSAGATHLSCGTSGFTSASQSNFIPSASAEFLSFQPLRFAPTFIHPKHNGRKLLYYHKQGFWVFFSILTQLLYHPEAPKALWRCLSLNSRRYVNGGERHTAR